MLHMVVITHGPETCAAWIPEVRQKSLSANQQRNEVFKKLGMNLEGSWVDPPSHTIFQLIDAPNAHVIQQAMTDLRTMEWNTVRIYPVITGQESIARSQARAQQR
jgi:hypothetical protein